MMAGNQVGIRVVSVKKPRPAVAPRVATTGRGFLVSAIITCVVAASAATASSAEITVERSDGGAVVNIDGNLFTEYLTRSGAKPILWPIIGPTGKPMTRDYPMRKTEDERHDHPHHRSLWFTHGRVGVVDFWSEGSKKRPAGTIRHLEFLELASGRPALIATRNAWVGPDGKEICQDRRTLRFDADADARWIDFDIAITAGTEPLTFGDTKEGSFGVRLADSMREDAKSGGEIVDSEGRRGEKAVWGKRAAWVDYHGPVGGETVGIAIMNRPDSFRYPTYWHVRAYGLFAANPFGLHDFTGVPSGAGNATLAPGKSLTLRYRVLLHRGDEKSGKVAEAFTHYRSDVK